MRVVAPLAGAWIETGLLLASLSLGSSRPSRARGLKRLMLTHPQTAWSRAPRGRVD